MLLKSILLASSIFAFAACGGDNVCEEAADICGESGDGECSGAAECTAECIVDADSCDLTDTALGECITACAS